MRRHDRGELVYLARLAGQLALGAAVGGHAYARRRVRAIRDRLS